MRRIIHFPTPNPIYFNSRNLISHFETGDLDNDKDLDLITISHTGALELFKNSGNGTFTLFGFDRHNKRSARFTSTREF